MATAPPEEVVSTKPIAEEPPLAAVMEKPPVVAPPPHDGAKALAKIPEPVAKKSNKGSLDRGHKKQLADVSAWENSKKASVESQLKKIEEQIEKKKGEYAEKMKKKIALVHKQAEEKRAMVEAKRGEALLKVEEFAAKYCATGHVPKKVLGCFGG
ncbi:remorin [Phtheirospermum japonicum]|uniref:Remorin n=1 Tax=Phtheirospermum japonicum TaxID=374723 RepID=A0A830DEF6_9LAMI|nr:remorin [Phtheirospermum japonicum]